MEPEDFQKRVLESLEKNAKFQNMTMEYMANITQQLVMLQNGQQRLEQRMDGLDQRMDGLERRMDGLDQRMDGLERRMDGLDQRMDGLDQRMTKLEIRMENEVIDKLKMVFEAVDGIDNRLTSQEEEVVLLKRLK